MSRRRSIVGTPAGAVEDWDEVRWALGDALQRVDYLLDLLPEGDREAQGLRRRVVQALDLLGDDDGRWDGMKPAARRPWR